ncbi:hypothetical protein [Thalassomonas actiniarum]|uniref:Uncharacterized protein n=1 Tax=Thalassomonas actiniarum TaxID=485447 RepID=A0AAE9YQL3_9GAMM|nr:hypothetical protein [Thalassomonas actiniarum]WDD97766.1 hypothetical protein SG35_021045 [Thalassomonas actiniarum]
MKFLFLLFLLISGYCLALSPKELSCSQGHDCFNRHVTFLGQVEDEIYQSLNKQLFPDLFRYDSTAVSFCDQKNKHCIKPAIFFYQQLDTGEKFLISDGFDVERRQTLYLLNPQWQKERLYHVTGVFFAGYRLTDAGVQIRYLRCSRHACRENMQKIAVKPVRHEY